MRLPSSLIVAAGLGLAIWSCHRSARETAHQTLSTIDPLRVAFNADSGKVRAIFLASPT